MRSRWGAILLFCSPEPLALIMGRGKEGKRRVGISKEGREGREGIGTREEREGEEKMEREGGYGHGGSGRERAGKEGSPRARLGYLSRDSARGQIDKENPQRHKRGKLVKVSCVTS